MPRKTSKKKPGVRKYGTVSNYTEATLQEALDKVKSGALSQRKACAVYKIPKSTLNHKLKKRHNKPVGHPISLSMEEEIIFRDHLLALSDMGVPIGLQDFRAVVQKYLQSVGKVIPVFKDNSPGYEWSKLYLERHPALKEKFAHNISRKRAQVNEEMVKDFFDRLEEEIKDVSPNNIYNMDESGFHDEPGKKKLLFRRSTRHPEMVRNSTKSCFTVVFAGNAAGDFIPPFFIFKGKHCWSDWLYKAPKDSKMAVSKSGWIDANIFEEWLEKHFVPIVNKTEGKKILLCDNLSAHISVKALRICEENNIKFICLIPNSTHLLQPLDVGYFASLKSSWRNVLNKWRQTQRGRKVGALPKNLFCQLVNTALQMNESTAGSNLITGFRKCGICPISRIEVLQVLPSYATGQIQVTVGETFKDYLQEIRESDLNIKKSKKFLLPVEAGKSISVEEVEKFYKNKENEQLKSKEKSVKRGRPKGSKNKTKTSEIAGEETLQQDLVENESDNKRKRKNKKTSSSKTTAKKSKNDDHDFDLNISQAESHKLIVTTAEVHVDSRGLEEMVSPKLTHLTQIDLDKIDTLEPQETENVGEVDMDRIMPETVNNIADEVEVEMEHIYPETVAGEYIIHHDSGRLIKLKDQEEWYQIGKFCVFQDEGTLFPGFIIKICQSPYTVWISCLTKNLEGGWLTPKNRDVTKITDLKKIKKVVRDENITRKGNIIFIEDDFLSLEWGE